MAVYQQQRRFDQIRSARAITRTLAIMALLVFMVVVATVGSTAPGTRVVQVLIGVGLLGWVAAFGCDVRVASHRVQSRTILAELGSVQARLDALEAERGEGERESS